MRGNSSTECNDLSNCFENRSGSIMSVDNVKGDANNASICDYNEGNVNRIIDNEQHQNDETMVLMEAPLDVVTKMDRLMEGLVETLRYWGKLNSADGSKIMIKRDEASN
ncbi:hypothetical protein F8M41_024357 [Gigaspora margarita]|uniref:Uncharacterized protein n=1 Tax=Gigaspora margarita TaxID=4874 RepID=A0A8H4ABU8_GIGMA|nr:hypothetical protein F8M41_024357 [Gigaspora margarita]